MNKNWIPPKNGARTKFGEQKFNDFHENTKILVSKSKYANETGNSSDVIDPLAVPIFTSTVYKNRSVQQYQDIYDGEGYIYQRLGNPTTESAEVLINELEQGEGCLMFTSGLAAVSTTFLCFLKQGDHLICQLPCYSGTVQVVKQILQKFGVEIDWMKPESSMNEIERLIKPNTKMIFGETPCNPYVTILDLEALGLIGKKHPQIVTIVDSTFAPPVIQKPLTFGIDISIHSCTKYINGHSDCIGGCATFGNVQLWKTMKAFQAINGSAHPPFDSYLIIRGMKTLPLRVHKQCESAMKVAEFLEKHEKVKKVWYPGLKSHPQHEIAKRQMKAYGGMISFEMSTMEEAKQLVQTVKLINLGISLGGLESLILHCASMPCFATPRTGIPAKSAVPAGLIRLSIGLEEARDIVDDLAQALDTISQHVAKSE